MFSRDIHRGGSRHLVGCWSVLFTSFDAHLFDWCLASKNNRENHRWPHFLVVIILLLYFLAAFNLYRVWALCSAIFTTPAWISFWESSEFIRVPTPVILTGDVSAILSTILADATLAWDLIHFLCESLLMDS